jgi:ATP-binding cassette subfamily B protein
MIMQKKVTYKDILRFSFYYWKRQLLTGIGVLAFLAVAVVIDAFIPVYTGKIIDSMVGDGPARQGYHEALKYLGIFAGLTITSILSHSVSMVLWSWFAAGTLNDILDEAMYKVQRFSADWHANTFAGGTVRKITRGMWSFDMYEDTLLMGLYPALLIMIGMGSVLTVKLPLVGIFTVTVALFFTALSVYLAIKVAAPKFRASAESDTAVGATLADIITGNQTVKAFATEKREDRLFQDVTRIWKNRSFNAWITSEFTHVVRNVVRLFMMIGMVGITIWLWSEGKAAPGDIALSLTSFFIINGYMRDIGRHITNLQRAVSEMEDIVSFWKREDEVLDIPGAKEFVQGPGEIIFDNVSFVYDGQNQKLFEYLSLEIQPGENVALVGHSGSGKSTFVKLLQRLYDVNGGRILIDGQNIAEVTQESLRRSIALVPQEPILFHRSIAGNIAYAKPEAGMDEVVEAAKKAYAHDFIDALAQGYDTLVGERGVKLSGGERQRVAIARAILADAAVLIFDEATSSLDSISEYYIQRALLRLMEGRTAITIAHRLSTVRNADRILVFKDGRIVEQGSHNELIGNKNSHYRQLYEVQTGFISGYTEFQRVAG